MIFEKNPFTTVVSMPKSFHLTPEAPTFEIHQPTLIGHSAVEYSVLVQRLFQLFLLPYRNYCMFTVQMEWMLPLIQVEISVEVYYSNGLIQWAQTKLVHMTLGNTSVLCTSLVCAHCIV